MWQFLFLFVTTCSFPTISRSRCSFFWMERYFNIILFCFFSLLFIKKNSDTVGTRRAWKCVPNFLHVIRYRTVWIYTIVQAKNRSIARNRTNFTIKSNTRDQKVNRAIGKPHCLNPQYSRTPCKIILRRNKSDSYK